MHRDEMLSRRPARVTLRYLLSGFETSHAAQTLVHGPGLWTVTVLREAWTWI